MTDLPTSYRNQLAIQTNKLSARKGNQRDDSDEKSYHYAKQQKQPMKNIKTLSFNLSQIDDKYIAETQKIYLAQCPSLKYDNAKQLSLFILLSIQRKNSNYPILLYLIDCYLRDRLKYFTSTKKLLNLTIWCNKYKTIKKLLQNEANTAQQTKLENVIISAMETYSSRYCTPMILPTSDKINDSMQRFIGCLHELGSLISTIKNNPVQILPFQIDLLIIPQDVIDITNGTDSDSEEESDSDNDSEEDSDSDSDSDSDNKEEDTNKKCIGDIKLRLESNNILYAHEKDPDVTMKREFIKLYQKYQAFDTKKKYQAFEFDNLGTDLQRIPHRKRLCVVVDRRSQKKGEEKNEIYLFEPPAPYNKIPSDHVREWYIESSYQCIIPGTARNENIKSKSSLDGWINVFSFHVEQADEIRCYFYRSGQFLRFMPSDIVDLFPHLFHLKAFKNAEFIEAERCYNVEINRMKKSWEDIHFQLFRKLLS